MSKGFRVPPQGSKKDQLSELKTELANTAMAGRISQMMTQQLMQSVKSMSDDVGAALNQLYELQYKYNAVVKQLGLNQDDLNNLANQQRLVDFNEAAAKQDVKDNLVNADVVGADSTVVFTTSATDEQGTDRGILRSRIKLSESGVPDLVTALTGQKVGAKVQAKLNGLEHTVELLGIRNPAPVEAQAEATH